MFYEFRQNNSGGSFDYDAVRGISVIVVVEANNESQAVERAESVGLYFDGDGDCPCCGDRWSEPWNSGDEVPSHYGDPINLVSSEMPSVNGYTPTKWMSGHEGFIHYADGRVVGFY